MEILFQLSTQHNQMSRLLSVFVVAILFALTLIVSGKKKGSNKIKDFDKCFNDEGNVYSPCRAKLKELRPTQTAVGYTSSACKAERYRAMDSEGTLSKFLSKEKRWVPAVLGYNEELYIIDHHHQSFALQQIGYDSHVIVNIVEDVSEKFETENEFWDYMKSKKWMYPLDERGQPLQNYTQIPKKFKDLKNDPFRTLASLMIYYGGISKVQTEFSEFVWANYLRSNNISLPYTSPINEELVALKSNFHEAMRIVEDEHAKNIPGYGKSEPNVPDCEILQNFDK